MIGVERIGSPQILQTKSSQWTQDLCNARVAYYTALTAYEQDQLLAAELRAGVTEPKKPRADGGRYGHDQVKAALTTMFQSKCCYCEARVKAFTPRHVEHFFPASIFPALAYEWTNLLFACFVCNSTWKSDHFPMDVAGVDAVENRANPGQLPDVNLRMLVDPCRDKPDEHFTFEEGRVVALTRRGELTRDVCGLNRDDLIDLRREYLELLRAAIKLFQVQNSQEAREVLKKRCQKDASFTAMTRAELTLAGIDWDDL